jgi:hypothetical protein
MACRPPGCGKCAQIIADAILKRPLGCREPMAAGHVSWERRREAACALTVGAEASQSRRGAAAEGGCIGDVKRTVSLVDLGWVVVAADDVRENGGIVDEARVNRFR